MSIKPSKEIKQRQVFHQVCGMV